MDPVVALEMTALSHLRSIDEAIARGDSGTQRVYDGSVTLVTGASGFLGKHLVEKLLRSTNLKKIYLLLRPKKGRTTEERLEIILADPVFDTLRKRNPDFAKHLEVVAGDITELRLGIAEEDWNSLTNQVDFIFHLAATTRFDESLRSATIKNVRGAREVVALAKACTNLKALIHVSTAFAHATYSRREQDVKEEVYPVPLRPELLIEMAETMDQEKMEMVTAEFTKDWPNTYCFTKAVAEEVVRTMAADLPVAIVRPAVVMPAYREPAPGWLDINCAYGPGGVMLGIGLGLIHVVLASEDCRLELVPVDLVSNATVAAGAARGERGVQVYTVTSARNSTTWGACGDVSRHESRKMVPTPKAVWYCFGVVTSYKLLFYLLFWLLHYIPAYFIDGVCFVIGKPRRLVKLYTKAYKLFTLNSYFTTNEWKFSDKNLLSLQQSMSEVDRLMFNFDVSCIDWKEYMLVFCLGLRKYIIKDGLTDTDYAVKKQQWLRILNAIVLAVYAYLWYKVISFIFYGVMYFV